MHRIIDATPRHQGHHSWFFGRNRGSGRSQGVFFFNWYTFNRKIRIPLICPCISSRLIDKNRQTDCLKLRKWTQQIKCNQLANTLYNLTFLQKPHLIAAFGFYHSGPIWLCRKRHIFWCIFWPSWTRGCSWLTKCCTTWNVWSILKLWPY